MKNSVKYLFLAAALGVVTAHAQSDCSETVKAVNAKIAADKSEVLNAVSEQISKNPDCACEIVKAAIAASKANKQTVGAIVEAAGNAAPDRLDLIIACATAAAPDASQNIRAAAAKVQGGNVTGGDFDPLDVPGAPGDVPSPGDAGSSSGGNENPPAVNTEDDGPAPVVTPMNP